MYLSASIRRLTTLVCLIDRTRILQKVLLGLHIACLAMLDACSVQSLLETRDIVMVYVSINYG